MESEKHKVLEAKINVMRTHLEDLIKSKEILESQIIKVSEELDDLIVDYYKMI